MSPFVTNRQVLRLKIFVFCHQARVWSVFMTLHMTIAVASLHSPALYTPKVEAPLLCSM